MVPETITVSVIYTPLITRTQIRATARLRMAAGKYPRQLNRDVTAGSGSAARHRDTCVRVREPFQLPSVCGGVTVATHEKGKGGKTALTCLVFTMPLTYFPRAKSTHKTLDSTARYRSRTPIFRSPLLPLACSPGSPRAESERERARERMKEEPARARRSPQRLWPQGARSQFRSCHENATRPRVE